MCRCVRVWVCVCVWLADTHLLCKQELGEGLSERAALQQNDGTERGEHGRCALVWGLEMLSTALQNGRLCVCVCVSVFVCVCVREREREVSQHLILFSLPTLNPEATCHNLWRRVFLTNVTCSCVCVCRATRNSLVASRYCCFSRHFHI